MPASYDKKWFFARTDKICGSWAGGPPEHDRQPGDQPGTLVHKGDSPAPQFDYPLPQYLGPDGELWSRNHFYYLSVPGRYGRPGDLQGGRHSLLTTISRCRRTRQDAPAMQSDGEFCRLQWRTRNSDSPLRSRQLLRLEYCDTMRRGFLP